MTNLKLLNWQPNKDSLWSKNGIELVGAVGAGIAYTVTGIDGKYIVTISNLVKAERGQPRSSDKISKDFDSLDEAKSFVEQEHYPHFMSEFVKPDSITDIANWFKAAKPEPTIDDLCVQIGCHLEETAELLQALGMTDLANYSVYVINELAESFKNKELWIVDMISRLSYKDKIEVVDACCDSNVTSIGIMQLLGGVDVLGAQREVIRSNNSKMVDGKFEFDDNGKIRKLECYSEPDLAPFVK